MLTAPRGIPTVVLGRICHPGEVHKRLAKWLCENYRCVLIPEFKTSQMVRRDQRKLRSKTVRQMLTWSHYRFRQRLLSKAREYDSHAGALHLEDMW